MAKSDYDYDYGDGSIHEPEYDFTFTSKKVINSPTINKNSMNLSEILLRFEPKLLAALHQAFSITSQIKTALESKQAATVESVIATVVPQTEAWSADVLLIVTAMTKGITALENPMQWEGILLRLGAEISAIIHGQKLSGIAEYITKFEAIFLG